MCRWVAYSGPSIPLAHYVTEPSHSLVLQSLNALEATTSTNGDGFGLGWYDERREPGLYREIRPAWSDENLRHLCRHIRSHLFFAHVRAATATAVTRVNCHPFSYDRWLFMHNGFVADWGTLRRPVESLIPDALYQSRAGTTDSEAIFLAIVGANIDDSPLKATGKVMRELKRMVECQHETHKLRFTAALSNGRDVYAFRYAVGDKANTLYYRSTRRGTVIASEPLDNDHTNWTEIPENCMLLARRGFPADVLPFSP